ncbi:MAG: hypothetical protein H0V07_06175 [Propionibacteriales bacterium]|nr:hypothetical protein [Propionibacteriales bacterium]
MTSWSLPSSVPTLRDGPHSGVCRSARTLTTGHAFIQNLRRGHDDIATDAPVHHQLPAPFDELALAT